MKRWARCWAALAPVVIAPAIAAGGSLESTMRTIVKRGEKVKSFSAKSQYYSDDESGGTKIHSEGQATYELKREGELLLYRTETSYTTVMDASGTKQTSKGSSLAVCDGEFTYMYTDSDGMKSVIKQRALPQGGGLTDENYFNTMKQTYNLELLPDAKVLARDTYVIRATPKEPSSALPSEQISYFDKETGVILKSVSRNQAGKITMETTTTDLKVNSTIDADRFVFHAPEGVEVTDLTQEPTADTESADAQQPPAESDTDTAESAEEEEPGDKPAEADAKKKKKSKWPKLPKKKWP